MTTATVVAVFPLRNGKISVDYRLGSNLLTDTVPAGSRVKVGDAVSVNGQGRIRL